MPISRLHAAKMSGVFRFILMFLILTFAAHAIHFMPIIKAQDGKEQPGELNWVHGIALDSEGNIYASDIIGQRAQKFVKQN